MFVHTANGPGRVVDQQSVRGRKSFLVEGKGFKVWIDEKDLRVANDVNEGNSTTLPYDPTPQNPTDMFHSESTMQPINDVDPDERLSPSDSLSFENESLPYPGPSSDNFAKNAGYLNDLLERLPKNEWDEDAIRDWVKRHDPHGSVAREEENVRQASWHTATGHSVYDLLNEQAPGEPNGLGQLLFQPDGGRHHDDVMYGEHAYPEITAPPKGYRGQHREEDFDPEMMYADPREQALYEQHQQRVQDFGRNLGDRGNLFPYDPQFSDEMIPAPQEYVDPRMPRSFGRSAAVDSDWADEFDHEESQDDPSIKHFSYRQAAGIADFASAAGAVADAVSTVLPGLPGKPDSEEEEGDKEDKPHSPFNIKRDIEDLAEDFAGDQNKKQVGGIWPGRPDGQTVTSSLYERPAGLSDKYVRIESHVDHYSDPIQQFRDDPAGFINKRGYMLSDATDIRLAEYIDLVEHDRGIRTAAWKDVRTKALRLRREGRVHVKDIAPNRIYANVEGDSAVYETMILKGAGNDQSISDWHCSCPWGRWAFKRQMSYVGRLCSHGYASYLEMESQQMKNNNKRRKSAGVATREFLDWCRENNCNPEHPDSANVWGQEMAEFAGEGPYYAYQKSAGIVEDFKQWADNENDGMIDQDAVDNFIYNANSLGDESFISEEDAEKLYEALDSMESTGKVRDYDVDYLERPGDVYKDAHLKHSDVLRLRPETLSPDYYFVEDGQDESWVDVTKDERKTTGPDNMIKKSRRFVGRELHYASDEELGEAVKDWSSVGSDLEKLRGLSEDDPDFQNMRDKNDEIRDVINELHDRGIDASQFVASLRFAADAEEDAEDDDKVPASQQSQPSMDGKANQTGQPGGSSSIAKPDASQTGGSSSGGLESPEKSDPAEVGFNSRPADQPVSTNQKYPQTGSGTGYDPANVMSGIGQAAGGLVNVVPDLINSVPEIVNSIGQFGAGIGSGIGSVVNSLSGLSGLARGGSNERTAGEFPDPYHSHEPFQGSGPRPKYWMESSECYVDDHERDRFVDVTDLDDDPLIKYTDENLGQGPKKSSVSRRPFAASASAANPEGSTLTSGSGVNDSGVVNLDQVYKAGAAPQAWDGHRVRDFRRYVKQQGGQPNHQMLQEYLKKPHRSLDQGSKQHLQEYTSYAEQHEASLRYAEAEMAVADVPGASNLMPEDNLSGDHSDIVAQFHRTGGIEAINNSGGGTFSDSAIADQARGFLRTAGRMYSLAEQRELENESHPKGARNLGELDLAGTHYEDAL